jgi:hypothetical protein
MGCVLLTLVHPRPAILAGWCRHMVSDGVDFACHDLAKHPRGGGRMPVRSRSLRKRIYPRAAIGWHTFRIVINQGARLSRRGLSGALSA